MQNCTELTGTFQKLHLTRLWLLVYFKDWLIYLWEQRTRAPAWHVRCQELNAGPHARESRALPTVPPTRLCLQKQGSDHYLHRGRKGLFLCSPLLHRSCKEGSAWDIRQSWDSKNAQALVTALANIHSQTLWSQLDWIHEEGHWGQAVACIHFGGRRKEDADPWPLAQEQHRPQREVSSCSEHWVEQRTWAAARGFPQRESLESRDICPV